MSCHILPGVSRPTTGPCHPPAALLCTSFKPTHPPCLREAELDGAHDEHQLPLLVGSTAKVAGNGLHGRRARDAVGCGRCGRQAGGRVAGGKPSCRGQAVVAAERAVSGAAQTAAANAGTPAVGSLPIQVSTRKSIWKVATAMLPFRPSTNATCGAQVVGAIFGLQAPCVPGSHMLQTRQTCSGARPNPYQMMVACLLDYGSIFRPHAVRGAGRT